MTGLRLGIVGGGAIGRRHASVIGDAPQARLVAVADPADTGRRLAADHDASRYADASAMFAAETLDGVVVSTPTSAHHAATMAALDAGLPVLVEKPISATVEEAREIAGRAEATGIPVLVGHHRRYAPQLDKAREVVRSGGLGRLVAVTGQWTTRKDDAYFNPDWRRRRTAGPVLTNLVHDMDALRYICGEVESVSAELSHAVMNEEKEDAAAVLLRFGNGALGTFVLSDRTVSPWTWEFGTGETPFYPRTGQNCMRFMGTEASMEFPNLTIWRHDSEPRDWHHVMSAQTVPQETGDAFAGQLAHFCAVIGEGATPRITARDAMETLRATLAVFEAAETGCRVVLRAGG